MRGYGTRLDAYRKFNENDLQLYPCGSFVGWARLSASRAARGRVLASDGGVACWVGVALVVVLVIVRA